MRLNEPPIDPGAPPPDTDQNPDSPQTPTRVYVGRHGELDTHELVRLLDTIDSERERARFRESFYISLFVWIFVAWFIFYGPRYLWHQPRLINPAEVLKQREITNLTMPKMPRDVSPSMKPSARPAPKPTIDNKTMEKLREMAKQSAPAPQPATPQPAQPTPQPATPQPAQPTPQPRTPAPVVADAPTPQPTRPNFGSQSHSAGQDIQQAIQGAARGGGGSGGVLPRGGGGRRGGPLNMGGVQVLSDTQGVNFDPYLRKILADIRRNWEPLIPPEAEPPLSKQGETYIRFTILPDGTIGAMHLDGSTHDDAINKSCWGSITSEGQFPPLPSQFHGPNLELRIHYLVNKQLDE